MLIVYFNRPISIALKQYKKQIKYIHSREKIVQEYLMGNLTAYLWSTLVKRALYNELRFEQLKIGEDAASFGVDKIPEKWVDKYKAGLIDFKALSVREDKAVDIVKNTIGITCHKVLDPTMLLERAEWDKIKKMPTKINGKNYILTYFLGGRTREVEKVIYRYAKLTDSAVINLQDYNTPYYTVGPDEFVGLISKAKMVLTDSFHATVFSIIYEKPFVVYDRQGSGKKMGSRLSSLLEMCGLNDRRASALDEKMLLQVDYTNARLAIQKEKVHSLKYLNEAIQSCGDSVG